MLLKLAEALQQARATSRRSLDDVAAESRISSSYLRKLERGEVNDPSPRVLRRVGAALDIDYVELMRLADYLGDQDLATPSAATTAGVSLLTDQERKAVAAFADFLVSRR